MAARVQQISPRTGKGRVVRQGLFISIDGFDMTSQRLQDVAEVEARFEVVRRDLDGLSGGFKCIFVPPKALERNRHVAERFCVLRMLRHGFFKKPDRCRMVGGCLFAQTQAVEDHAVCWVVVARTGEQIARGVDLALRQQAIAEVEHPGKCGWVALNSLSERGLAFFETVGGNQCIAECAMGDGAVGGEPHRLSRGGYRFVVSTQSGRGSRQIDKDFGDLRGKVRRFLEVTQGRFGLARVHPPNA